MQKVLISFLLASLFYACKSERSLLNSDNSLVITDSVKATKIYHLYKEYKFNLLIAFKINSPWVSFLHPEPNKILGRRNRRWYKIELYKAGTYKSSEYKDSIAQKPVNANVNQLLKSYNDNNLYSLKQEYFQEPCLSRNDTIINGKHSIMVSSLGGISDMPTLIFTIINNSRYTTFKCHDPWDALHICPEIKAYQYVLNMYNDIKKYW